MKLEHLTTRTVSSGASHPPGATLLPGGVNFAWNDPSERTLCCLLESRLFTLNAHFEPRWIALPPVGSSRAWHRVIDTSLPAGLDFAEENEEVRIDPAGHYIASPRSTVVLLAR